MPAAILLIWRGIQAFFVAVLATKIAKLVFSGTVIVVAYNLATGVVDDLVAWLGTLSEPVVAGEVVPILAMMQWSGFFEALSILLGAHLAVLTIRLVMRGVDWL